MVLGDLLVGMAGLFFQRQLRKEVRQEKRLRILILNTLGPIPEEKIKKLKEDFRVELSLDGTLGFREAHRKFKEKIGKIGKEGKVEYSDLKEFIEKNPEIFPDLVILCSDTSVFKTSSPFLLYSAETLHYREEFSESVLRKALSHYRNCKIRNGR